MRCVHVNKGPIYISAVRFHAWTGFEINVLCEIECVFCRWVVTLGFVVCLVIGPNFGTISF